jgi:hypothetical protein
MKCGLRFAVPLLAATLAFADAGYGSETTPSAHATPRPVLSHTSGRVIAMATAPVLGAAGSFAVLGASTVTNTGPSVVNGDLGVSPGTAITGFPPGVVNGTTHAADAAALAAQNAVTAAYVGLAGQACNTNLTGQDLGGLTLTPGVYCFSSSAQLTGTVTLNGLGNAGAVWVFQIGTTLTTASGSRVAFINGGQPCGTFWQIGSSATLGTNTTFSGNILALASITLNTGAANSGALFARTGAVTLDSNPISTVGSCGIPPVPALPEVAAWALLAILLAIGVFVLTRS